MEEIFFVCVYVAERQILSRVPRGSECFHREFFCPILCRDFEGLTREILIVTRDGVWNLERGGHANDIAPGIVVLKLFLCLSCEYLECFCNVIECILIFPFVGPGVLSRQKKEVPVMGDRTPFLAGLAPHPLPLDAREFHRCRTYRICAFVDAFFETIEPSPSGEVGIIRIPCPYRVDHPACATLIIRPGCSHAFFQKPFSSLLDLSLQNLLIRTRLALHFW